MGCRVFKGGIQNQIDFEPKLISSKEIIALMARHHVNSQNTKFTLIFGPKSRAQLDWAYEFPDRTGPDTQICQMGPA